MRTFLFCLMTAAASLSAPLAWADELSDVEMDVMDANGTPNEASTKVLALPDEASDTAREHAQRGLDAANAAREDGAAFGEGAADAARDGHGKPEDPGRP